MNAELKLYPPLVALICAPQGYFLRGATACWPLAVVCAAIDGYREAQKAVLQPEAARRVLP